jgi:hypothetical protein
MPRKAPKEGGVEEAREPPTEALAEAERLAWQYSRVLKALAKH